MTDTAVSDVTAIPLAPSGVSAPPTYSGPREVLVNKPVNLKGGYDARRITKVTIAAEDRYTLNVTMSAGIWQVSIPKGFSEAGTRWIRLKGFDRAGKLIENRVFYITVSSNPLTVGQTLSLKVVQDTFFKSAPIDSAKLNGPEKIFVKAGQTFTVVRYGFLDGHLKLELAQPIGALGTFGYFYEPCIELSKGSQVFRFDLDDVPDTKMVGQLMMTTTATLKARLADSTELAAHQKVELPQGQTFEITGYACTGGHFRVTLAQPIPGFGNRGYVYWQYARIKRSGGREVTYDSSALTLTAVTDTILKKRPVDSSQLEPHERATFNAGAYYGVSSYAVQGGHIKVALTEEVPGFGNTGYIYPSYAQMKRGQKAFNPIPQSVELSVPYFSQRDNPRLYWSTCNVTSIAMVMYYYGVRSQSGGQLEDELLQWCLDRGGEGSQTDHNMLTGLIRAYGFNSQFSTTWSFQDVKEELINGRPVVLCGLFTHGGHIVTAIGYTPDGWIVNDPWGDALTGYSYTEGRKILYPYNYVNQVAGPDGGVWAHLISK